MRRWCLPFSVCLCVSTAVAMGAAPKGDWPQWRGPGRENKSSFKGINTDWNAAPPKLLWKIDGLGGGYASVSIQGDRLYTTGNHPDGQNVIAVDLKNQKVLWKKSITDQVPKHGYDGSRCTPTIDGDRLYAVSSNGGIACLKAASGEVLWQHNFKEWGGRMMSGWGFSESPLVDDDHVLCTPGGKDALIVCLNKADGKVVWKAAVPDEGEAGKPGAGYSSIVVSEAAGVKQYVTLVGRGAVGVRAGDGQHLWSYNKVANVTANIPTCLVTGDYVFTSSGYGDGGSALLKLSKSGDGVTAEEVYYHRSNELQNHHGGMVLVGDHVYFGHGHNKGFPVCVDLATGKTVWEASKESRDIGNGSAGITYVDGHLVFRYQSGQVALIEATPSGFRLKGTFKPEIIEREGWSHPVVVDGKLYLREQNHLMVYDIAAK